MRTDRVSGRAGLLLRAALAAALGWALPAFAPPAAAAAGASDSLTVTFTPLDVWPPSPVTDLTGLAGAEGQMLLQWTAPDSNNFNFANLSPAAGYQIRVATFSIASVAGSTATWWSLATDVTALPAPATPTAPPTPGAPGTMDTLLLTRLEPGVTYWAMIVSSDNAGLYSNGDTLANTGAQDFTLITDDPPSAPILQSVVQTGISTFTVTFGSVNAYDLDFYRLYIDSTAPYDFANAWTVVKDSPTTGATLTIVVTGLSTGTYHFRLTSVDKGSPTYGGWALESSTSNTIIADLTTIVLRPQAPFGIYLTTAGFTTTLRWMPVTRYADGTPFADASAPTSEELTGYRVYRATIPTRGTWTDPEGFNGLGGKVIVGTTTVTFTDLGGGPQYYYHVRSENVTSLSRMSLVRAAGSQSAWVVAPDDQSSIEIPPSYVQPVEGVHALAGPSDPMTAYLVEASSRPQDLGGRVLRSIDFGAWKGGAIEDPSFSVNGMGLLRMHYDLGAAGTVTAQGVGGEPLAGVSATPQNMSVYWFNGSKWVQLYGDLDTTAQLMIIETKYFGKYQLRTVERPLAFNFNQAGISNRMVTPNGDGKNDAVIFTYDNPRDSEVTVRILDIRGKQVTGSLPAGPVSNSRVWAPAASLPGGVYIYQIESEGQTFSGTIVIIK